MRFFALVDFKYLVLAIFLGLISLILVYLAWGSYPRRKAPLSEEELGERTGDEILTGHDTDENPVAPFLVLTYIGFIIWALAYAFFVGVWGGPVGY